MLYSSLCRIFNFTTSFQDSNFTNIIPASSTQSYIKHYDSTYKAISSALISATNSMINLTTYPFSPKARYKRRTRPTRPPPPFSVLLQDATTNKRCMILSCICIPPTLCHPVIQKAIKCASFTIKNKSRPRHRRNWLYSLLPFLLLPTFTHAVVLPGTNHAIINGKSSRDSHRQQRYIKTILKNCTSNADKLNSSATSYDPNTEPTSPPSALKNEPCCFISDTDSEMYVVDIAANRYIVNDAKMMTNIRMCKATIKGIGGEATVIKGIGTIIIKLESDDGRCDNITIHDAVYVPSSPYNLLPPQLLIAKLKSLGYIVDHSCHDDNEYVFHYRLPAEASSNTRHLTVPIGANKLFNFYTHRGFTHFFKRAKNYTPSFAAFAGEVHFTNNDDDDSAEIPSIPDTSISSGKPRETTNFNPSTILPDTTREPQDNPREYTTADGASWETKGVTTPTKTSTVIPHFYSDFDSLKSSPLSSPFCMEINPQLEDIDPSIASTQRKKARLATLHESLGHLSFARLKLLARVGIISRDLATVDPPTCPGYAYGKAHHKPWRYKGITNLRPIKQATAPGDVVSTDQLISPTLGFVPTHRGKPTLQRYMGATIFVDHFSDLTYVHLMTTMNATATVEAKLAFERFAASHGVIIKHYHCDNGLYDTKKFKASVNMASQTISFCGVNVHHQNGRTENRIQNLTTNARTALI